MLSNKEIYINTITPVLKERGYYIVAKDNFNCMFVACLEDTLVFIDGYITEAALSVERVSRKHFEKSMIEFFDNIENINGSQTTKFKVRHDTIVLRKISGDSCLLKWCINDMVKDCEE